MGTIVGCDFHPSYQQIAMLDTGTGEMIEKSLRHEGEEVRRFYAELPKPVRVGIEASGQSQWFERLLAELGHQVWLGDAGKIRSCTDRKQKTDRRDAAWLLQLLLQERFPRIWVPTAEQRDRRQLLLHRHKLVRLRVQVKNQLQALALNQGVRRRWRLWSATGRVQLEALPLLPWAGRRRQELLQLLDQLGESIAALDQAVMQEAWAHPGARRLMTHPGVGPVTALAFVLTLGPAERFPRGKQVASYFGLIPSEHSSGGRQRLGHISKQGSSFVRGLLVEAAQSAVRHEPELRRQYQRLSQRKCRALAKVAMARKLAVRLYWMLRRDLTYAQLLQGSHAGVPESFCGRG
ncbi:MAG TPA: IS110 family transposase [Terriglobales bacterium]|nr:IS110 family transposase [Terriglobales bacterium]